ncbi:MAG: hypothetical protein MRT15_11775 [archaeon YNP-LCB-003-016]|uniref:hypothetical protein n=1 Tax=Candidatus Culexarchaeum yellowstonense TaxID=2928963 RepID=UPI0026E9858C|nr:hypothetical protein [Candidatus Culexarchaeum yellowstonense]MCR6693064.1 hypothetical protein [Candidatus Culexarchaeum yellowstonense]
MSEKYPCIYGLRDHCEAIEFAFKIVTGGFERELKYLSQMVPEPKTDEERFVKKVMEAIYKYTPQIVIPQASRTLIEQTANIIVYFCKDCPHRLNAIKKYEPSTATSYYPSPRHVGEVS